MLRYIVRDNKNHNRLWFFGSLVDAVNFAKSRSLTYLSYLFKNDDGSYIEFMINFINSDNHLYWSGD